jgi:hypothetical protein
MDRVSIIEGKEPVIFVAPHGFDDKNTDVIAKSAAEAMNAYAVINHGWIRADKYDYDKEHANCNNINHCLEDVVKDEFLNPIIRYKNKIRQKYSNAHIFLIHGMSDNVKKVDPNLTMIVGYGDGNPASFSCKIWQKNYFLYLCEQDANIVTYEGRAGSGYAGWSKNNLNQYFRKYDLDKHTQSLQLEIAKSERTSEGRAEFFAENLAAVISDVIKKTTWDAPSHWCPKGYIG